MRKSNGESTHPCLTPDLTGNHFVSPVLVRTQHRLSLYIARRLSRSWPCTPYSSRTVHSWALLTRSNAFSWSMKMQCRSWLNSIDRSHSWRSANTASVQPLFFLNPNWASLSWSSAIGRIRFSRIFAYNFPVWLSREIPLYFPQSLLLPSFSKN